MEGKPDNENDNNNDKDIFKIKLNTVLSHINLGK